jgi:hypothetical protein
MSFILHRDICVDTIPSCSRGLSLSKCRRSRLMAHTHTHTHTHTHIRTHTRTHARTHTHTHRAVHGASDMSDSLACNQCLCGVWVRSQLAALDMLHRIKGFSARITYRWFPPGTPVSSTIKRVLFPQCPG